MGFLSGLTSIFGGGSGGAAKRAMRQSRWLPSQLIVPGYTNSWQFGDPKSRTPDQFSWGLDSQNQALRDQYFGLANTGIERLMASDPTGGVNLGSEFDLSNQTGLPAQFYDPENFRALTSAAGGLGQSAFADAQSLMGGGAYDKYLQLMRSSAQDYENNFLQGGMDKQFLKGILGSTAGQYQTQGMMDAIEKADIDRQLQAFGMSETALNNAFSRAGMASDVFQGLESDGANRGFLINQLQGTRADERFARAMQMFNSGNAGFGQAMQLLGAGGGGLAGQDAMLANLLGLQGNLSAQRSGANAQAYGMPVQANQFDQGIWASIINGGQEMAGSIMGGGK